MQTQVTLTHKGWFGLAPVYFGNLESEAPAVIERHWSLGWLIDVSDAFFQLANVLASIANADHEPFFALRVTGELTPPKVVMFDEVED